MKTEIEVIGVNQKIDPAKLGLGDKLVHKDSRDLFVLARTSENVFWLIAVGDGLRYGGPYKSIADMPLNQFRLAKCCKITVEV